MNTEVDFDLKVFNETVNNLSNCLIFDKLNLERYETEESEINFYSLEAEVYRDRGNNARKLDMSIGEAREFVKSTNIFDDYVEKNEFLIDLLRKLELKTPGKYKATELRFIQSYTILEYPSNMTEDQANKLENLLYKAYLRFKATFYDNYILRNEEFFRILTLSMFAYVSLQHLIQFYNLLLNLTKENVRYLDAFLHSFGIYFADNIPANLKMNFVQNVFMLFTTKGSQENLLTIFNIFEIDVKPYAIYYVYNETTGVADTLKVPFQSNNHLIVDLVKLNYTDPIYEQAIIDRQKVLIDRDNNYHELTDEDVVYQQRVKEEKIVKSKYIYIDVTVDLNVSSNQFFILNYIAKKRPDIILNSSYLDGYSIREAMLLYFTAIERITTIVEGNNPSQKGDVKYGALDNYLFWAYEIGKDLTDLDKRIRGFSNIDNVSEFLIDSHETYKQIKTQLSLQTLRDKPLITNQNTPIRKEVVVINDSILERTELYEKLFSDDTIGNALTIYKQIVKALSIEFMGSGIIFDTDNDLPILETIDFFSDYRTKVITTGKNNSITNSSFAFADFEFIKDVYDANGVVINRYKVKYDRTKTAEFCVDDVKEYFDEIDGQHLINSEIPWLFDLYDTEFDTAQDPFFKVSDTVINNYAFEQQISNIDGLSGIICELDDVTVEAIYRNTDKNTVAQVESKDLNLTFDSHITPFDTDDIKFGADLKHVHIMNTPYVTSIVRGENLKVLKQVHYQHV